MALWTIASFELVNRLKRISTWVYCVVYAFLGGMFMAVAGGAFEHVRLSMGGDKILINGPYSLAVSISLLGFTGVTVIAALFGRAVQQDFEYNTFHFLFTAPIRKRDYFLGRFLGAYLTLVLVMASIWIGIEIGAHWPGVEPARVAPFSLQSMLRPYLFVVLPNMLWLGGVFFILAALTRAMAPVYIGGVLVLIGYLTSRNLIGDVENKTLAALFDPVGINTLEIVGRYWSVAEKNTRQFTMTGLLLWNRVLWVGLGLLVTAIGYHSFRMDFGSGGRAQSKRKAQSQAPAALENTPAFSSIVPPVQLDRRPIAYLGALPATTWMYLREAIRNPRFYAVAGGGAIFLFASMKDLGSVYGTSTWPVTYQLLELTSGFFSLFILIVTAINAGELVWRERDARMDEIVDSTPVPGWLGFFGKLLTLFLIQGVLLAVVMVCCIGIQLWQGYTRLEIGHYLFDLFALQWPRYWLLATGALTLHVLINQKYLAHFVVVVIYIVISRLPDLGFEDRLYRYGTLPIVPYSNMNGYGHFLPALYWFQVYWSAVAVLLLVLAYLLWVRGKDRDPGARLRGMRERWGRPALVLVGVASCVFVGSGAWIFYNTHVLNPFLSEYDRQKLSAEYEKRYKRLEGVPQPKITAVDIHADLYPREHRAQLSGTLTLVNKSGQPIMDLYVMLPSRAEVHRLDFGIPAQLVDKNPDVAWLHYRLQSAFAPGATLHSQFEVAYQMHGFTNDGAEVIVLDNGTFLNGALGPNTDFQPRFGYSEQLELTLDRQRKRFGLAPKERAHDLDDRHWQQYSFSTDADWIDYHATISTDADQLPTTSGYPVKRWTENGRTYIEYTMDSPMALLYPLQSGRYRTRTARWGEGEHEVAIEIDYQPGDEFDLDRMIAGVQDSLSYYTSHYGPYQHRILRIIEFPRYASFAESFPNTVPFSEAIGFIAKVDDKDPKDIDYPYFVTAHEVAHQWWAHQVMPANVQGGEFITESLAEYSALMVLRHRYGDAKMRRFLKYELDRYLLGRSTEDKKEQPLMRADGPTYLHYQKGSLALYAMQDAIGEDALARALASFVSDWHMKGPPYATSRDLLARIREVTPADKQYLIHDLFETITVFDNRATAATARALGNGQYEVNLTVVARKLRADGLGAETEIPMNEDVDVGVLDANDVPLMLEKRHIHSGSSQLRLIVQGKPVKAGIDPLNKLIDKTPDDNTIAVEGH